MSMFVVTSHGSYLQSVAYSIALLAYSDKNFRERLGKYLFEMRVLVAKSKIEETDWADAPDDLLLQPIHCLIADEKLAWLSVELEHVDSTERDRIRRILSAAAVNMKPSPQIASWGFIFNETLGPFVAGHPFNHSKLEYSQVVILEGCCRQVENFELAKQIHSGSIAALNRCVEDAGYNFRRLEPEVIEWLSCSRELELYLCATKLQFEEKLADVRRSTIKFALVECNRLGRVLALQPSTTGTFFQLVDQLTPVK